MLLSRLFNGRLSPTNLSRCTSFATANAPEANLGSSEEDGNVQACCWVTARNEESSSSASGSSGLQRSCATRAGSQPSSGSIAARAEMISFAVDSEVACPNTQFSESYNKLTGSGSEIDAPSSTYEKQCFAAASLITTESRRVQAARWSGSTVNPPLRAPWQ